MQKQSKRLENALQKVEHVSKLAYLYWDIKSGFNWSDEIYSILELNKNEISKDNNLLNSYVLKSEKNILKNNIDNCIKNGGSFKVKTKVKTKSKIKDVLVYGEFYKENNKTTKVIGYIQDISENVEKENKLENTLEEKEVLLKEVHHRVKNNLQIILSLLRLDERFNSNNPKETLEATKNRINSMAKIHEKIYQSSDLAHVNLKEYIKSEINGLFSLYSIKNIKRNFKLDNIDLDIEKAIPIGLIINEIVHNTIKYAFPNKENGNLTIILKEKNKTDIELIIKDDGIGMPESFNLETSNTLGLIVIKNLIYQIEGTIEMIQEKGTGFRINFKK